MTAMINFSEDYKKMINLLDKSKGLGTRPGLDAISELLSLMGNPHNSLKYKL